MPILSQDLLKNIPYRRGNTSTPKLIFVGIGPGKDEFADPLKRAFVGYSGQILDKLIDGVNVNQSDCYFTNVIKERVNQDKWELWIHDNPQMYQTYLSLLKSEIEQFVE